MTSRGLRLTLAGGVVAFFWSLGGATLRAAQDAETPPTSLAKALSAEPTGDEIFKQACATCHAIDGTGATQATVGFALPLANGHGFPDFTDCPTNTVEPLADWIAVATRGGPIRALDRHMPAFGDALSPPQIERVVRYLWSFCPDPSWPRGDLNFPRAFFTEKAFPENEAVWTTGITARGTRAISNELLYEHRIGARGQYEITVPVDFQHHEIDGRWSRGLGDIEVALRRTLFVSTERGRIVAAGGAVTLPTGKEDRGLGNGFAIVEPFAMYGQTIRANGFLQLHAGYELPLDHAKGENEGFMRMALGYSVARDGGFGRTWSPIAEILVAKREGSRAEWDVVPQMQISLSKLQHVLVSAGVRLPMSGRANRKAQLLTYVLWDWFDGGLFDFWK